MRSIPEWIKDRGLRLPKNVDPHPWKREDFVESRFHDLVIAAYNVWRKATKAQTVEDFHRILAKGAHIVGWSEARIQGKGKDLQDLCIEAGWGYYQGKNSDTSISWDEEVCKDFHRESFDIEDSWWRRTQRMPVTVPLVGLMDKRTGHKFFVLNAHTQVRGRTVPKYHPVMVLQYRQIRNKMRALEEETGLPVFLVGDLNNRDAKRAAPKWYESFKASIDYIFHNPRLVLFISGEVVKGIGFDHKRDKGDGLMNSDHPLVIATYRFLVRS